MEYVDESQDSKYLEVGDYDDAEHSDSDDSNSSDGADPTEQPRNGSKNMNKVSISVYNIVVTGAHDISYGIGSRTYRRITAGCCLSWTSVCKNLMVIIPIFLSTQG